MDSLCEIFGSNLILVGSTVKVGQFGLFFCMKEQDTNNVIKLSSFDSL